MQQMQQPATTEDRPREMHLDSCSFRMTADGIYFRRSDGATVHVARMDMDKIVLAWVQWAMQGYWS